MSPLSRSIVVFSCVGVLGLAGVALQRARGQAGAQQLGVSTTIEKEYADIKFKLTEAATGNNKGAVDPAVSQKAAKYFIYRFTWPILLDAKGDPGKTEPLDLAVREFDDNIKQIQQNREKNSAFVNQYAPALVSHFKELTDLSVVENSRGIIHAVRMLPSLAKLQHDAVHEYLLELLDEKSGKHDIIKLWALRALREFPPIEAIGSEPFDVSILQDKNRMARKAHELKRVDLLTKFILRRTPSKMVTGELEAYRYLRREAIETLAKLGAPCVAAVPKRDVEGPIAPLLARVILPNQMDPDTSLAEKVEAALGLCNMQKHTAYDTHPAAFLIGTTFVELGRDYNQDWNNIALKEKRFLPTKFPWKLMSKEWERGFKQYSKSCVDGDKYAAALEKKAVPQTGLMMAAKQLQLFELEKDVKGWGDELPKQFLMFKPSVKSAPLTWEGGKDAK